jgi:hypothetical protein
MVNRSSDDTRSVCRGSYYNESFAIVRLEGPSARLKVSNRALNATGRCGGRKGAEVGARRHVQRGCSITTVASAPVEKRFS